MLRLRLSRVLQPLCQGLLLKETGLGWRWREGITWWVVVPGLCGLWLPPPWGGHCAGTAPPSPCALGAVSEVKQLPPITRSGRARAVPNLLPGPGSHRQGQP